MLIYLSVDLSLCPPNSAAKSQRKIIKQIREEEFKYEGREPAEINWTQYDQAQIKRRANYLNNIRDLVDEVDRRIKERIQPKKRGPGRMRSIAEGSVIAASAMMRTRTRVCLVQGCMWGIFTGAHFSGIPDP